MTLMARLRAWRWPFIPLILLSFTTMVWSQAYVEEGEIFGLTNIIRGLSYAVFTTGILFAHEMGHYLTCKKYGVEASRPYFIPGIPWIDPGFVIPMIGTFGAFIKMELAPMSRSALMRIAAYGPIAGFIVAIPTLFLGMSLSEVKPVPEDAMAMGDSLMLLLGEIIFAPGIPAGSDLFLHPIAMAGWVGCLLTALNLLPMGQLDGGHIAYAFFGKKWEKMSYIVGLIVVLLSVFQFAGWLVLGAFVFKMGWRHPEITTEGELEKKDIFLAGMSLVIFILTFTPAPIEGSSLIIILSNLGN